MAKKKQNQKDTPKVNPELEGFDIKIDPFGEIKTNFNIDRINEFLNKNVDDKKLRDRDDLYMEEKRDEDLIDDELLVENQLQDMVEDELNEEDSEDDIQTEDDYDNEEGFDDFSIEDDDVK